MMVGEHGIQTFNNCGCCVVAFVVVVLCYCPHKCTSHPMFGQVFCQNKLKCQMNIRREGCGYIISDMANVANVRMS